MSEVNLRALLDQVVDRIEESAVSRTEAEFLKQEANARERRYLSFDGFVGKIALRIFDSEDHEDFEGSGLPRPILLSDIIEDEADIIEMGGNLSYANMLIGAFTDAIDRLEKARAVGDERDRFSAINPANRNRDQSP